MGSSFLGDRIASITMSGDNLIEDTAKFFQAGSGNDNGVAPTVRILRDAQKTTTRIFAQIKNEMLALDRDIFTFQDGIHRRISG